MKKIVFLLIILPLVSYQVVPKLRQQSKNDLVVDMVHKSFDDEFFIDSDYYYTSVKISSFNSHPKYTQYLKDNYRGIPQNDSISFHCCIDDRFIYEDFHKLRDLSQEDEDWYQSYKFKDTLNNSKIKLKSTLIIVIGFYKDQQFMIADVNRNKDFSDDIKYEYGINFRNNPEDHIDVLNKQPLCEYSYERCYKGNIQRYDRKFIIYPDRNNRFSISDGVNPKKEREYFSVLKFRDYWKGEATVDNKKIDFIYHCYRNDYGILTVKPNEVQYENSDYFENQYTHKYYGNETIKDTITINDNKYMIDSISRDISKLYLKNVGKRNHFGHEVGDYVSDFEFNDLQNKSFKLNSIVGKKKYTLLEFWGTWCGPCVAMTPKLKELNQKFSKNLNIVSVAVDNKKEKVVNYIKEHNMNWKMAIIPKSESPFNLTLKKLKVEFYPTFILIDDKGRIISREEPSSFEKILEKIK
ncbi:TlpA family protein disulfide reductase [Flavobacterium sp.]|jgi:thiol-disulfide isomerase/thioredoxin|uniref:TlpA family protein disulfide reductase n=1 Tax=Flavobacterium sp. TaxID=239 RepID=UPI0037BFB707